jgi:uncharacterized membrane protein
VKTVFGNRRVAIVMAVLAVIFAVLVVISITQTVHA